MDVIVLSCDEAYVGHINNFLDHIEGLYQHILGQYADIAGSHDDVMIPVALKKNFRMLVLRTSRTKYQEIVSISSSMWSSSVSVDIMPKLSSICVR